MPPVASAQMIMVVFDEDQLCEGGCRYIYIYIREREYPLCFYIWVVVEIETAKIRPSLDAVVNYWHLSFVYNAL